MDLIQDYATALYAAQEALRVAQFLSRTRELTIEILDIGRDWHRNVLPARRTPLSQTTDFSCQRLSIAEIQCVRCTMWHGQSCMWHSEMQGRMAAQRGVPAFGHVGAVR